MCEEYIILNVYSTIVTFLASLGFGAFEDFSAGFIADVGLLAGTFGLELATLVVLLGAGGLSFRVVVAGGWTSLTVLVGLFSSLI